MCVHNIDVAISSPIDITQTDAIIDTSREQLQTILQTRSHPDQKVLTDLRKRKLINMQKISVFEVQKGPKFAREFVKEETDLTADMIARLARAYISPPCACYADLCSGSWKTIQLKPYNFNAKGALATSGSLHPRMTLDPTAASRQL